MVTNNVTVYQFEVGLDEVFADEVRFHVNVDCVIVVVVKDCLFFVSFILCENCEPIAVHLEGSVIGCHQCLHLTQGKH